MADIMGQLFDIEAEAIGVDMPIGLPEDRYRDCDLAARRLLGSRACCVFLTPPRAVLDAPTYAAACAVSRDVSGKALSRQAWNLLPRIREVNALAGDPRLVEVHPEVSFTVMTGAPLLPKRTADGHAQRLAVLGTYFDFTPPSGRLRIDALDALAAAWSARRWTQGVAIILGGTVGGDTRDQADRPMFIAA
jgi:predicted RNase H-like nuclease